jgi:hypothetical protein
MIVILLYVRGTTGENLRENRLYRVERHANPPFLVCNEKMEEQK